MLEQNKKLNIETTTPDYNSNLIYNGINDKWFI